MAATVRSLSLFRRSLQIHRSCQFATKIQFPPETTTPLRTKQNEPKLVNIATTSAEDDSDTFGTLADQAEFKAQNSFLAPSKFKTREELDDHDGELEYLAKISDTLRPRPEDFERKIQDILAVKKDLAKALKVFDDEMSDELVRPNEDTYRMLIHACGKVGYAAKASNLFFKLRSTGAKIKFDLCGDVFNGCANCPDVERPKALKIAHGLRQKLLSDFQKPLPVTLYHTMIKAFGRCEDIEMAFAIMDEMVDKGLVLSSSTFNHLLQACITDKQVGFRLALVIYRRMLEKRITPDVFTFNLILRATTYCGVGEGKVINDILIESLSSSEVRKLKQRLLEQETKLLEQNPTAAEEITNKPPEHKKKDAVVHLVADDEKSKLVLGHPASPLTLPNLLAKNPNVNQIVGLNSQLNSPRLRFQLIGDLEGFLHVAVNVHKAKLDIKTFSQMLNCIESTNEIENLLLEEMKKLRIKPDVDFFNQLIRQRVRRNDNASAKQVLELISDELLEPNLSTFGCLALCMECRGDIFDFLKNMKKIGLRPNVEIMTALINSAGNRFNLPMDVVNLLKTMETLNIQPNDVTVIAVEKFYQKYGKKIRDIESGKNKNPTRFLAKEIENGLPNWTAFIQYYQRWLKQTSVLMPEHPWDQYKTQKDIQKKSLKLIRH
jgi:pentatricopeptide repeat domain-containing protein 1